MNINIKQKFDDANKYIFIKQYDRALKKLDAILLEKGGSQDLLIHLRRIELTVKLDKATLLRDQYLEKITKNHIETHMGEICVAFIELYGNLSSPAESCSTFKDIIEKYEESAAAYFGLGYGYEILGNLDRAVFNYKQSLKFDPNWFPSYFGLSQAFYQKDDIDNGDHYFYIFEKFAPFNLYGNFDTHKKLSDEFLVKKQYNEAEIAIKFLTDWWLENKGTCPIEVQIYENLMIANIAKSQDENEKYAACQQYILGQTSQILNDPQIKEDVLYFVAKALEEFSEFDLALKFYQKILHISGDNPDMIKKIGNQFLSMGELDIAKKLFDEAYMTYPDISDIKYCRLITHLKIANVSVEDYLNEKNRIKEIIDRNGDYVDILAHLFHLLSNFPNDPDIHGYLGEIYQSFGNLEKAEMHYKNMYELDHISKSTCLRYAAFLVQTNNFSESMKIIDNLHFDVNSQPELYCESNWIKATIHAQNKDYESAINILRPIMKYDPWNVNYLTFEVIWMILFHYPDLRYLIDPILDKINSQEDDSQEWKEFFHNTLLFEHEQKISISYSRYKLYLLYEGVNESSVRLFVSSASKHDVSKGFYDLLKLLNTNFDSLWIYWGLGALSKELWQLETAIMWFEQILSAPGVDDQIRNAVYIELADCYVWQNTNIKKGVEYIKVVEQIQGNMTSKNLVILSHAYLRLGEIRKAQNYLSQVPLDDSSFESQYLDGLLHYRNGSIRKAKVIWKPLLTAKSKNLRIHHIKQELMKYYFNGESYLKVN